MNQVKEYTQINEVPGVSAENEILDFFNGKADIWDDICSHNPEKLACITSLCCINPGDNVLDIACGTGVLTPYLLQTGAEAITGIDVSEKMIRNAEKKISDGRVRFEVGDIYNYSTPGWNVAVIYCAFPHLKHRKVLVEQLCRLLVPGGRFLIAHSESAEVINRRHDDKASGISVPLQPAEYELIIFEEKFRIDTLIDTDEMYVISGVLK